VIFFFALAEMNRIRHPTKRNQTEPNYLLVLLLLQFVYNLFQINKNKLHKNWNNNNDNNWFGSGIVLAIVIGNYHNTYLLFIVILFDDFIHKYQHYLPITFTVAYNVHDDLTESARPMWLSPVVPWHFTCNCFVYCCQYLGYDLTASAGPRVHTVATRQRQLASGRP